MITFDLPASNPASAIPIILLNKALTDIFIQYVHILIESIWLARKWSYALLSQNITKPPYISFGEITTIYFFGLCLIIRNHNKEDGGSFIYHPWLSGETIDKLYLFVVINNDKNYTT